MQEPEDKKNAVSGDVEKAGRHIHGLLDRIRQLEHPGWQSKDDDIVAIKASVTRYASELEHLNYKYEARGAELERLKAQYADLERMFQMRPDAMRKAGETEIADLVRRNQESVELERALLKGRTELEQERSRLAAEAAERSGQRLAELEKEYSGRRKRLEERENGFESRISALAEGETRLREKLESIRKQAVEESAVSFEQERAAMRDVAARERGLLEAEAGDWRAKAREAVAQLSEARARLEKIEKELLAARETASAEAQKRRLAEMDGAACLERLTEWEKKGADLEGRRADMAAREEKCARAAEEAKKKADEFKAKVFSLQIDMEEKQKKFDAAKAGMRAEIAALVRRYRK